MDVSYINNDKFPKKKGRKPKNYYIDFEKYKIENNIIDICNVKIPKKRGRKPKGGKIHTTKNIYIDNNILQHVILHLKCNIYQITESFKYIPNIFEVESYSNDNQNYNFIEYNDNNQENDTDLSSKFNTTSNKIFTFFNANDISNQKPNINIDLNKDLNIDLNKDLNTNLNTNLNIDLNTDLNTNLNTDLNTDINNGLNTDINKHVNKDKNREYYRKSLYKKLNILENNLHSNFSKKCNCFWCTYEFDNIPVYIPSSITQNKYNVYGNFCSLECACGYLFNETIDMSTKFERYYLLNNIYNYDNIIVNIKPAPSPLYLLDRFNGNLTIQEYRDICKLENNILLIDKPITKIVPELFQENNDYNNLIFNKNPNFL